jgi:hypothetical protein
VELKICKEESLGESEKPIAGLNNFQKAVRFANIEYQASLKDYDEKIRERLRQEQYNKLVQCKNKATTEYEFQSLAKQFRAMNGYKNTIELANDCDELHNTLQKRRLFDEYNCLVDEYNRLIEKEINPFDDSSFFDLAKKFRAMNGYKNTDEFAKECEIQYNELHKGRKMVETVVRNHNEMVETVARNQHEKLKKRMHRLEKFGFTTVVLPINQAEKYDELLNIHNQLKSIYKNKYKKNPVFWYKFLYLNFKTMNGYKNSDELANACKIQYKSLQKRGCLISLIIFVIVIVTNIILTHFKIIKL